MCQLWNNNITLISTNEYKMVLKNITEVFYGVSPEQAVNVTDKVINFVKINKRLDFRSMNCNSLFGDPYINQMKLLIIYVKNRTLPAKIFYEYDGQLTPTEYFFNLEENNIYIISNATGGSGYKYINDLINHYTDKVSFKFIRSKSDMLKYTYNSSDIIFLQDFLLTDLQPCDIIELKKTSLMNLIISIHDLSYLKNIIDSDVKMMFDIADIVIHPSIYSYQQYGQYLSSHNFRYVCDNDINVLVNPIPYNLPMITDKNINIGFYSSADHNHNHDHDYIAFLNSKYNHYNGYNMVFNIIDLGSLQKYNLHGLAYLDNLEEVHGYSLTEGLNSGLPIIYNNFGVFKGMIKNSDHYFRVFENESTTYDMDYLCLVFEKLLDYIIANNGKVLEHFSEKSGSSIKYNQFYDYLFDKQILIDYDLLHEKILPFAMYFPQFHEIAENNTNFYEGYTDIINLKLLKSTLTTEDTFETPVSYLSNSFDLSLYNLERNSEIIPKQVLLAESFGLSGFAIYYYWFSTNTITNQNIIMKPIIDKFFESNYPKFRVFFSWANQNWTDDPSFGNCIDEIKNVYSSVNFEKNTRDLMVYFRHNNYLKIDNRPVFAVHLPWYFQSELEEFREALNNQCLKNGFFGVHLICNSMDHRYDKFINYQFHANYKKWVGINGNKLDYNVYSKDKIAQIIPNDIQSIFFDFNNSARLFKPDRLHLKTEVVNNTHENMAYFLDKCLDPYHDQNRYQIKKVFLINAWNEWGEKMTIEPSNEKGNYYLDLLLEKFLKLVYPQQTKSKVDPSTQEISNLTKLFTEIHKNGNWKKTQNESDSGDGSTLKETECIRKQLESLLISLNITSLLDASCGDFNWMRFVNLPQNCNYVGCNIVDDVVQKNMTTYGNDKRKFIKLNICQDYIPNVDLIFCRDCLVHLSLENTRIALQKFHSSGSKYLLTTTFPNRTHNSTDAYVGSQSHGLDGWQPLNLQIEPFNLPPPLILINEECTESNGAYSDKSLGLWKLDDIADSL